MVIVKQTDGGAVEKAVTVLQQGGIIAFPTDTSYGLGVDATNNEAVAKLYKLKERDGDKPMHVIVSDIDMAGDYVEFNEQARKLSKVFLPGPLTLVLRDRGRASQNIVSSSNTLGIRVPDSEFAQELSRLSGVSITATSANKSGDSTSYSIDGVRKSFGRGFKKIDLAIDAGKLPKVIPSTLVDLTGAEPRILREGPISMEQILAVLG